MTVLVVAMSHLSLTLRFNRLEAQQAKMVAEQRKIQGETLSLLTAWIEAVKPQTNGADFGQAALIGEDGLARPLKLVPFGQALFEIDRDGTGRTPLIVTNATGETIAVRYPGK